MPSLITELNEARERYLDLVSQAQNKPVNGYSGLQHIFSCFNIDYARIFTFDSGHKVQYIPQADARQIIQGNSGANTNFPYVWNSWRGFGVEYDQYKGNTWRSQNVHWYPLFLIEE